MGMYGYVFYSSVYLPPLLTSGLTIIIENPQKWLSFFLIPNTYAFERIQRSFSDLNLECSLKPRSSQMLYSIILKKVVGTLKYGGWWEVLVYLGHNLKGDCGIAALFPFSLLPGCEANSFLRCTHMPGTYRNMQTIDHCLGIEPIKPMDQSETFCFLSYLTYFVMATGSW